MAKYRITPSSKAIIQLPISIGHKAEKGVEAIEFDLTAWVETYGSGTLTVIMRRWGDAIPYPIALEIDENNKATWTLSDTDTAKAGMAYAQLNYVVGDEVVKKSDIYTFRVMDSLTGEGDPPEAYESWLEHLTHFAAEAMAEVLDIEGIVTDKTLTVDGGIADAKKTGDEISAIKADLFNDVIEITDTFVAPSGSNYVKNYAYKIEVGKTYELAYFTDSQSGILNAYTKESTDADINLETIAQNISDKNHVIFTASQSAGCVRIVCNKSGSFYFRRIDSQTSNYDGLNRIKTDIDVIKNIVLDPDAIKWVVGGINSSGNVTDTATRIRFKNPVHVRAGSSVSVKNKYYLAVVLKDANNNIIELATFATKQTEYVVKHDGYLVVSIRANNDDSDLTDKVENTAQNCTLNLFNSKTVLDSTISSIGLTDWACYDKTEAGSIEYAFEKGKRYYIENQNTFNGSVRFSLRHDPNGVSYLGQDVWSDSTCVFVPDDNYEYLRFGNAVKFCICSEEQIFAFRKRTQMAMGFVGEELAMVKYAYPKDMIDPTADIAGVDFSETVDGCKTIMDVIYAKFDSLTSEYPSYITKVDAGADVSLAYPEYANLGGDATSDYEATPSYKTYMYVLSETNASIYNSRNRRKKMLLVGANHGREDVCAFNCYLIAKNLCECANEDYFKLRSAFDIYIVPCLNGYGMYHNYRWNGNGVDPNRNYPVANWTQAGSKGDATYTGEVAGSEFEPRLIMALQKKYNFNVIIDHHNFDSAASQFYTTSRYDRFRPISNAALVDCSYAFIKNLPYYFGTKYKLFLNVSNSSYPSLFYDTTMGTLASWAYEQNVDFGATIEVSDRINYLGGQVNQNAETHTIDTFKVAEFTLRNQLCHYTEFVLGN